MMCLLMIMIIAAATATVALAETDPAALMDDVVVTASRTERKLADSPVATELISRAELESSGAEDVAEFLQKHPGVHVVPSVFGTRLQLQGLDSKYVMVLLDGERVVGRKYGILDLSRYTVESIERIEIVKGNLSALYGSDAIGGVINIITRAGGAAREIDLHMRGGEYGSYDASAAVGLRTGDLDTRLTAEWHQSDAFDLDPSDAWTTGNSREQYNLTGRSVWRPHPDLKLTARGELMHQRLEGVDESGAAVLDRHNTTDVFGGGLAGRWDQHDHARLTGRLYFTHYRDQFIYDQRGSNALDDYQDTQQDLLQASAQRDWYLFDDHYLTFGTEIFHEELVSDRLQGGQGDRTRLGLYLQDEWEVPGDRLLVLLPGLRLDHDSQFDAHVSPKLSARFDPDDRVTLRSSYGLGFRAPDFKELYMLFEHPGVGYRILGNPELDPELSRSLSAGLEYRASESLWLSLSAYRHDVEDLIQAELEPIDGDPIYRWLGVYRNVSEAVLQGVELSTRVGLGGGLRLELGYAYLDSEDGTTGEQLEGRARHRGSASLAYVNARSSLSLRGTWVGERPFSMEGSGYGTTMADPYALLDFRASRSMSPGLRLFAGVSNILDEGDNDFLPVMPRRIYSGINLSLSAD